MNYFTMFQSIPTSIFSFDKPTEEGVILYNGGVYNQYINTETIEIVASGEPSGYCYRSYIEWDISILPINTNITKIIMFAFKVSPGVIKY